MSDDEFRDEAMQHFWGELRWALFAFMAFALATVRGNPVAGGIALMLCVFAGGKSLEAARAFRAHLGYWPWQRTKEGG